MSWQERLIDRLPWLLLLFVVLGGAWKLIDLGILHTVNTEFIRLVHVMKGCRPVNGKRGTVRMNNDTDVMTVTLGSALTIGTGSFWVGQRRK